MVRARAGAGGALLLRALYVGWGLGGAGVRPARRLRERTAQKFQEI